MALTKIILVMSIQLASSVIYPTEEATPNPIEFEAIEPPECVEIKSLQQSKNIDFNGYWEELGIYNNNPYYTLNGNYLFLSIKYGSFIISTQLGDAGSVYAGSVYAFCAETKLISCSSKWYYIDQVSNGWTVDSDAVTLDCSNVNIEAIEAIEPIAMECVEIRSLQQSKGIDFNGYWHEEGIYNHNLYYTLNEYYLFVSIKYDFWIISTRLADTENIYVFCLESNIASCAFKWYYMDSVTNSWIVDYYADMFECGNMVDPEPMEAIEPIEAPECVGIHSLQQSKGIDFNGYWEELGIYNNNLYYTLNGYYLFVSIKYHHWIISTSLGDTGNIYVLCLESKIASCSFKWHYLDSVSNAWIADSDAVMIDCSNMIIPEPTDPIIPMEPTEYEPFECVGIKSLQQSKNIDFNGYWDEEGIYNNNPYYILNANYLFVSIKYDSWIISSQLSDTGSIYVFCTETNIASCSSKWYYIDQVSNAWIVDPDAVTFDCDNMANNPSLNIPQPTSTQKTALHPTPRHIPSNEEESSDDR